MAPPPGVDNVVVTNTESLRDLDSADKVIGSVRRLDHERYGIGEADAAARVRSTDSRHGVEREAGGTTPWEHITVHDADVRSSVSASWRVWARSWPPVSAAPLTRQ